MEASPAYLTWSDKVAPRIRGAFAEGAVKLVVILRDPTARAYSHYWHRVRLGHEPLAFREAIAQEEVRLRTHWAAISTTGNGRYGYVRAGCYASRLRPFFAEFNRRDVHVLIDDDLRPDRFDASMARLAGFLGIDAEVRLRPARRNTPAAPRHAAVNTLYWRAKETVLARAYRRLVPRRLRRAAADAVFRPAPYPPMDADVERELRMRFADEVGACQHLIGRDLSAWLPR
jgi:hypothetical protein